jgi:hypothetical protein
MSSMEPRRSSRMTRSQRAQRAYTLTLATGGFAVLTVVLFILAVLTSVGAAPVVIAALLTGASGFGLKKTLGK